MIYTKKHLEAFLTEFNYLWHKYKDINIDELRELDAGKVLGYEEAFNIVKLLLDKYIPDCAYSDDRSTTDVSINQQIIFNALCDTRYDKNATGQFSAPLKSEFTDYALKDISNKLYIKLKEN